TIQNVAPSAGAIVPVKFEVEAGGRAAIIRAQLPDGAPLPFGAEVLDSNGNSVGSVAQGSRIVANSLKEESGRVIVKWGSAANEQCAIDYEIPKDDSRKGQPFHLLQGTCSSGG